MSALVVVAASGRRAVKIAGTVRDHAGERVGTVTPASAEGIEHGFGSVCGELEDRTEVVGTPKVCCAKEIARLVFDQSGVGLVAIVAMRLGAKGIEDGFDAVGRHLENSAATVFAVRAVAPQFRRAVEIAVLIREQGGTGKTAIALLAERVEHGFAVLRTSALERNKHGKSQSTRYDALACRVENWEHRPPCFECSPKNALASLRWNIGSGHPKL